MVPAASRVVTWVPVGSSVIGSRRKQGTFGVTLGTVPVHSGNGGGGGPAASGSGIAVETTRPVTCAVECRFCIVKAHSIEAPADAGVGKQFLVDPIPRPTCSTLSVPALLLPARAMLDRELLLAPTAQGVTTLITPEDPVKSEPPSPPAPPITKASRLAGLPTESIWPASTPLSALTTGPVLGALLPSSTGLHATAVSAVAEARKT